VIDNLNILDYDYYFKVTDAILSENISSALLLFNEILNNGFDGHNFVAGMGDHFRNLLVSKDPETLQLLEVGTNIRDKYKDQSGKCSLSVLIKGLTILNKTDINYKSSKNHRLQVELSLMQLCSLNSIGNEAEKKNDLSQQIKPPVAQKTTSVSTSSPVIKPIAEIAITSQPSNIDKNVSLIDKNVSLVDVSTVVKKPFIKTATISIHQHLSSEKKTDKPIEENIEQNFSSQPQSSFSQFELEATWDKYANELKEKGKTNLSTSLLGKRPVLKDGMIIEFPINNKAIEESINEEKMPFLGFLRKELNNYSIQLHLVMSASDQKTNLYTATDRYKRLVEKNPAINKFRQRFDLDVEF
jgi:DNA polymerase-3 subunit gamma/tau